MEKNEIVINGVHHVLVENGLYCSACSLQESCINSLSQPHEALCRIIYKDNCINKHFEIKEEE